MAGGGIAPSSSYAVIAALCLFSLSLSLPSLLSASAAAAAAAAERRANKSSPLGGILWATGKDESELDPAAAAEIEIEDEGGADGGFSSLESMLQWAIGHSDPAELKEKASDVQRLTSDELKKSQLEIKELMERLKMPSDAELMKVAIDDLNNSSLSLEDRQRALNEILILVEPIDNANDLGKLGGLVVVVRELYNPEPEIRMISASVLGKASQNNPPVQNQILALGTLPRLMKMIQSSYTEEAIKALYAISALIRDNDYAQELFYSEDGNLLLQGILSNFSIDTRLQKKAVTLVADLADYRLGNANSNTFPLSNRLFLKSIVDLTSSSDLVLQEKALLAIRSLVQLPSTEALDFKDHCNLDIALDKMKEHLEGKMKEEEEDSREYARDVEILRHQVHAVFHEKLEKVQSDVSSPRRHK